MADTVWKDKSSAPKDGNPVLLIARLNIDGAKFNPVVGRWLKSDEQWRSDPQDLNEKGVDLVIKCWAPIPELPEVFR